MTTKIKLEKYILEDEKKFLTKAEKILEKYKDSDLPIYNEYKLLFNKYKKLTEQTGYIFKISDTFQIDLIESKVKLENEIEIKNKTVKKLKNKVDKLMKTKQKLESTNKKLSELLPAKAESFKVA